MYNIIMINNDKMRNCTWDPISKSKTLKEHDVVPLLFAWEGNKDTEDLLRVKL